MGNLGFGKAGTQGERESREGRELMAMAERSREVGRGGEGKG